MEYYQVMKRERTINMIMKNHKNGREKKLLQLVLLIGTVGATQSRRESKTQRGDIILDDENERRVL